MMGNQMMVSLDRALSNTLLKRLHLMRTLDQTSSLIDKLFKTPFNNYFHKFLLLRLVIIK